MRSLRSLAPVLAGLFAVATMAACAPPEEGDVGDGAAASSASGAKNTNPAAGKKSVPVVVVSVDAATTQWISGETSKVDGTAVGTAVQRQRELYYRLQTAINAGTLEPAVVHYGITFSKSQPEARKITDAFSKVVDASKVPVVLEADPAGGVDGTLYHSLSWSDPPNMLIGQSLLLDCAVEECDNVMVSTRASALTKSMPLVTKAAGAMARSSTVLDRDDALDGAEKELRVDAIVMNLNVKLPKISLKELLTSPARAREVKGAFLVVAPPAEVRAKTGKALPVKLDELKGAVTASLLESN